MAIAAAVVLLVLFVAAVARQGANAEPLPGVSLRELGRQRGIFVGTAVRSDVLTSTRAYRQLVAQQFSSVTPENEMKWAAVEATRGRTTLKGADAIVDAAQDAHQAVRGHTFVWHVQYPAWVEDLGPAELRAELDRYIRMMVGRYRGRVETWDVANEVITDSGGLRQSVYQRVLGPGYIADAFRTAREADPSAKLYINEIGADGINPKSDALYRLVSELKAQGVPIDGVGFQVHSNLRGVPPSFVDNMRRFAALGLTIAITEADVGLKLPATPARLRAQARVYDDIVRACLAVKECRSLTLWGFTDGRSWIPETQPGMGAATLLDEQLRPKPAFEAMQRALGG